MVRWILISPKRRTDENIRHLLYNDSLPLIPPHKRLTHIRHVLSGINAHNEEKITKIDSIVATQYVTCSNKKIA